MSSNFLVLLVIMMNNVFFVKLQPHGTMLSNMTCINISLASLSSRADDRFGQLKLFSSPHFMSNYSRSCGKFDMRSIHTVYAKSVNALVESLCAIFQARPMLLIYLNDYTNENHASSAAYIFFLKLFTFLQYPMLTFHYFHPFHPGNFPSFRFFQLAPTYREEARALISLMERYDWNTFSLIIDPHLPGEEELTDEFEMHENEQRNCKKNLCNRIHLKGQKKLTILSKIHMSSTNPVHIKQQLSFMNPETRVIIIHTTSTLASLIVKQASNMSLTGAEYMWIMSSIVLSTYSSGTEPKMNPFDNPNRRKIDFFAGTLALYNDVTRDTILARFDKYIGPILINVFSKITHLDELKQINKNVTASKRPSYRDRLACARLFSTNTSLNQPFLVHKYPNLYHLLKDEFKRAYGIFQQDGLAVAGNYSVLNFQVPNKEWKKVGEYVNSTLTIADIQWPGERSKPPPGKPVIYYLRVATLEEHPFVMLKDPSLDGQCQAGSVICRVGPENSGANHSDPYHFQCCSGFYIDIFSILKDRLKFEFELYQVPDRTWGGRNPLTNKWNGLVAELLENRADLTLTSLKVTTERNLAIDFSVPLMETGIALIVSLRRGAISTTAFLKPYDYRIWILILLVTLHGVAIMVFLFEYFQKRFTAHPMQHDIESGELIYASPWQHILDLFRPERKKDLNITFFQSVWLSWVILFRAPAKVNNPKGFTSKFMANIWACFCLAFTASYTANLAAFMITKDVYFDLSGITDHRIANPHSVKPPFRFGTVANGSTDEVVKTNHKHIYTYMKQFMKRNISEGVKALKAQEIHAFLYDAVVLDYLSGQDDECKLRVVGNWYAMTGYGIGFPKQSKFKDMINKEIIEMHYSGEIERLRRFWFTGACKSNIEQQSQRSSQQLDQRNFTSAFLLLLGGTFIAIIILICENVYSRFVTRSKQVSSETKARQDYKPMMAVKNEHDSFHVRREKQLQKRIEMLNKRIHQLETERSLQPPAIMSDDRNNANKSKLSFLVLPVTYTPEPEKSPKLEIVSLSPMDETNTPLLLVEKMNNRVYETIV
ncbi:unnamed protein product [Rotaria socialis]|uniref:Uncharacterized protein n=2 Tax=Rotaria TaxID=231623 RepID=A0A820P5I2_9BILA|nr:unnamed protein product [Rotaria socialis]CAF4399515.1 unnamed protein product [Rotaria socialis]CAF4442585.1 unnamed protein product [Rotaria socialis]